MRTPVMLLPRLGSWSNALARRGPKSRNQLSGEQWHRRRDQSLYKGSVGYDVRSLPPYSLALRDTVGVECGLDGTGRVRDGCGPGALGRRTRPARPRPRVIERDLKTKDR